METYRGDRLGWLLSYLPQIATCGWSSRCSSALPCQWLMVRRRRPRAASQIRAVPSSLAVRMGLPSGLKTALATESVWRRVCRRRPLAACPDPRRVIVAGGEDELAVRAEDGADAAVAGLQGVSGGGRSPPARSAPCHPAGGHDEPAVRAEGRARRRCRCGRAGCARARRCARPRSVAVLSSLAVTTRLPSGLKAALVTLSTVAVQGVPGRRPLARIPDPRRPVAAGGGDRACRPG